MIKNIKEQIKLAKGKEVIRRYFIMNSFDGVLTVLGVLLGSFISGTIISDTIIKITLATGLAMLISGSFGTFATEQAERKKVIMDLEHELLTRLDNSVFEKANKTTTFVLSIVDGVSPLLTSIIIIFPFFFSKFIGERSAFYASVLLSFVILFILGIFLGGVSGEKKFISGLKMLAVGFIAVLIISLLGLI